MAERDPYKVAGAAMREAIDRALAAGLGERQWRVFGVVLKKTASYSKLSDRLYLAAIADDVFGTDDPRGWQVKRIGQDLRALADLGVIEREPPKPGRPKAGSGGARYRVSLPRVQPSRNGAASCAVSGEKGSSERAEREQRARGKGAADCTPTEEPSEKSSEEGGTSDPRAVERFDNAASPPPRRCSTHADAQGEIPPCGACKDARLAREAWDLEHLPVTLSDPDDRPRLDRPPCDDPNCASGWLVPYGDEPAQPCPACNPKTLRRSA